MHEITSIVNNEKKYQKNITVLEQKTAPSFAIVNFNGNNNLQNLSQKNSVASNEFSLIKRINKKTIADFYSYLSIQKKQEELSFNAGILPEVFNNNLPYKLTKQYVTTPSFITNNYITLRKVGSNWLQNYKAGFSGAIQKLQSQINLIQQNNIPTNAADSFVNQSKWSQYKVYVVPEFEKNNNKLNVNFSLPVNYQQIFWKTNSDDIRNNYLFFTPSVKLKYSTKQNNFFSLRFGLDRNLGTIDNAYTGYILQNFKSLNNNNLFISDKKIINSSIGYNFSIPIKLFFANIAFNHSYTASNSLGNVNFENNLVKTSSVFLNNNNNSILLLGGISKYIFKLKTAVAIKINLQQSNYFQLQNKDIFKFSNNSMSTNFTINSKINQKITSNYSFTFFRNTSKNIVESQNDKRLPKQTFTQIQQQLFLNINVTTNFYLKYKAEYLFIKQKKEHNYFFNDVAFFYNIPKKQINIILAITNVSNTQSFITNNVDAFFSNENVFYVRPRQLLITTAFTF